MKVYKLFRMRNGKLFPLYVEAKREIPVGEWLTARVGEKVDETHVKASLFLGILPKTFAGVVIICYLCRQIRKQA